MKKIILVVIASLLGILVLCTNVDYTKGKELGRKATEHIKKEVAENNIQQMNALCRTGVTRRFEWGGFRCWINALPLKTLDLLSDEEHNALSEGVQGVHRVDLLLFKYNAREPEGIVHLTFDDSKRVSSSSYTHHFNTLFEIYSVEWYMF